jgi:hypothetical protein
MHCWVLESKVVCLIMGGATLSTAGSFKGSVTVPQGLNFVVGDVLGPSGFLSTSSEAFNTEIHVNRFYMDYYNSGEVELIINEMTAMVYPYQFILLAFSLGVCCLTLHCFICLEGFPVSH